MGCSLKTIVLQIETRGVDMKKISCLFNHKFKKVEDVIIERFENDNRAITVFTCKDCHKDFIVITRHYKAKFKDNNKTL